MSEHRAAIDAATDHDRELDHARRNHLQGELIRREVERLRRLRELTNAWSQQTATVPSLEERRHSNSRRGGRGGRRRGDLGRPWWQKGVAFAAVCALLRCWRIFRR